MHDIVRDRYTKTSTRLLSSSKLMQLAARGLQVRRRRKYQRDEKRLYITVKEINYRRVVILVAWLILVSEANCIKQAGR